MRNKYRSALFNVLVTLASFIVMSSSTNAAIFKCVNTQGETYYNDKPCPKSNEETEIKAIKDPKGGYKSSYASQDNNIRKKVEEKSDAKNRQNKRINDIKKISRAEGQSTSNNTTTNSESSEKVKKGSGSSSASGISSSSSAIDSSKERDLSVVTPSHLFQ